MVERSEMSVFLVLDSRGSRVSKIARFLASFSKTCVKSAPVVCVNISVEDGVTGASLSKQVEPVHSRMVADEKGKICNPYFVPF